MGAVVPVYLEVGTKKVFASALEWPGWARRGPDRQGALDELVRYGPRYAAAVGATTAFRAPEDAAALEVVDELEGGASTDFGALGAIPDSDGQPLDPGDLGRLIPLLRAAWTAFDRAVGAAEGLELQKGPRGGGRDLPGIVRHVFEADRAYLRSLGGRFHPEGEPSAQMEPLRAAAVEALGAAARGELPDRGPRGGRRWPPRYLIRRSAWHSLDHAWEIEDRTTSG